MAEETSKLNRRQFIARSGVSLGVGAAALAAPTLLTGCGNKVAQCADPEMMSAGERHMRATREYVAVSSNPDTQCKDCAFYWPDENESGEVSSCAHCEIVGGMVNATGHCNAWAAI